MLTFRPALVDATVVYKDAEKNWQERVFRLEERVLEEASEFLRLLERLSADAGDVEAGRKARFEVLAHCLTQPLDSRGPFTMEESFRLTPSVMAAILDKQGELYGFVAEEEKLGKKFRTLLDLMFQQEMLLLSERQSGSEPFNSVPQSMESTLTESGEPGPGAPSTASVDSASETTGEKPASESLSPAESPAENPTGDLETKL